MSESKKTKAERKAELQKLVKARDTAQLMKIWHRATEVPEGQLPDRVIGSTHGHLMRDILNAEYPGDDSIDLDPR